MPRNFVARESFVGATAKQTKDAILSIPAFVPNIRLVSENRMNESVRFLYELPIAGASYYIDAGVLPLTIDYTRVSLHGRYSTGQAFDHDSDLVPILVDFEAAVKAALGGDVSAYIPYLPTPATTKKFMSQAATLLAAVGMLFLKKKWS